VKDGVIGDRIDFVFTDDSFVQVNAYATLTDFKGDHFPSDHIPGDV
jgi:hypothetical protein